jgi:hypothetical protein
VLSVKDRWNVTIRSMVRDVIGDLDRLRTSPEIAGYQNVKILSIVRVHPVGHRIDPISVGVERRKHGGFRARCTRVQAAKRALAEEEGNFHRTIMRPEANAPMFGIVAAAEIGKVQSHF